MSIVKIHAIAIPSAPCNPRVSQVLSHWEKAVQDHDGFQGFELLGPTDFRESGGLNDKPWERSTWLVMTRWDTEEHFQAWDESPLITTEYFYGCRPGVPLHLAILDYLEYWYDENVSMELWSYAIGTTNDYRDDDMNRVTWSSHHQAQAQVEGGVGRHRSPWVSLSADGYSVQHRSLAMESGNCCVCRGASE